MIDNRTTSSAPSATKSEIIMKFSHFSISFTPKIASAWRIEETCEFSENELTSRNNL